jgi:hypothetical protein
LRHALSIGSAAAGGSAYPIILDFIIGFHRSMIVKFAFLQAKKPIWYIAPRQPGFKAEYPYIGG